MIPAAAIARFFRSSGLAVLLLLAIASLSAVGAITSPPAPESNSAAWDFEGSVARVVGLQKTFSSPLFLALVGMFVVNVVACSWHRLSVRRGTGIPVWRSISDVMIHGSLVLLVVSGTAKVLYGFVGTQNIYVGGISHTVYDWRSGLDTHLGFSIKIDDFQTRYYPIRAKVGLRRTGTGEKIALLELVEGSAGASPSGDMQIEVGGYDHESGTLRLVVLSGGDRQEAIFDVADAKPFALPVGYDLVLVAYRADVRSVWAVVSLQETAGALPGKRLGTNDSLVHRGFNLFLTAWGTDPEGKQFCGIQVVRDPGAAIFWVGCTLLALAIPLHVIVKKRRTQPAAGVFGSVSIAAQGDDNSRRPGGRG